MARHWIQLHLSTCIVLMFVAGALIFLNMQPNRSRFFYGYPKPAICPHYHVDAEVAEDYPDEERNWSNLEYEDGDLPVDCWIPWLDVSVMPMPLAKNLVFALAILVFAAVGIEWMHRRVRQIKT